MSGIKCTTNCEDCLHSNVCSRRHEPLHYLRKIQFTQYGPGPNDDYDLKDTVKRHGINIIISCDDFEPNRRPNPRLFKEAKNEKAGK